MMQSFSDRLTQNQTELISSITSCIDHKLYIQCICDLKWVLYDTLHIVRRSLNDYLVMEYFGAF